MAIQTITNSGPPITNNDVIRFENTIRGKLPAPYRRFLVKHNGGRPEPHISKELPISTFYGIKTKEPFRDLLVTYRIMRQWLPNEVIAIACDVFGDQVCLAIQGKNRGKVYCWDHEGRPENVDIRAKYPGIIFNDDISQPREPVTDDWPGEPDLVLIADSFTEFLDSFHDPDLDEPKVRRKRPK